MISHAPPSIGEWPPSFARGEAPRPQPPRLSDHSLRCRAIEWHEQVLARTADDDETFERLTATSARVDGATVVLRGSSGEVVGRYRWAWRLERRGDHRPWVLRFEAVRS